MRWLLLWLLLSLNGCAEWFMPKLDFSLLQGLSGMSDMSNMTLFNHLERGHIPEGFDKTTSRRCAVSVYDPKKTLCREIVAQSGVRWWHTDENGNQHALATDEIEGEAPGDFEVDRGWRYVAMISAEEGHPFLTIYDLEIWIDQGKRPPPVYTLNPYPGNLHLGGWENNHLLHALSYGQHGLRFSTNGPINAKEAATGVWPLEEVRDFRWERHSFKVSLIPPLTE